MNEAVAEVLKELRKQKNISQEQLAEAIGSHQVYISEIEQGKKLPSLLILYHIAIYYEISLTKLVEKIENEMSKK